MSRKKTNPYRKFFKIIGVYFAIQVLVPLVSYGLWKSPVFRVLLLAVLLAFLVTYLHGRFSQKSRPKRFALAFDDLIREHLHEFKRQYTVLVQHDDDGKPILRKWNNYVELWMLNTASATFNSGWRRKRLKRRWKEAMQRVTNVTQQTLKHSRADMQFSEAISPSEFEGFCANELRGTGWTVFQTRLSGDQGVDLIAEKGVIRVALQCKLYSHPVGNSAVQQVAAGRIHHRASHGVVVTNHRFTDSAKALARSNQIHLLHHTQLGQLEEFLAGAVGQMEMYAAA